MDAFIERSRLGRAIYELSADCLKISGTRCLAKFALEAELRELSSEVKRLSRRFYRPALVLFGIGSLQAGIVVGLCFQKKVPFEGVVFFVQLIGMGAVCAFMVGAKWIPCLEVVRFKNNLGGTLFDIIKEKGYADEFEAFVEKLRENIRCAKEPGRIVRPTAIALPKAAFAGHEHWWKVSLALGIFAFGQPAIKPLVQFFGDWQFMVTFFGCAAGVGSCVGSFLKKERFRYLSLLGAALSFVTPLCY